MPEIEHQYIFIVGMPRSGTTLTEQILASHSDVVAIGESGIVKQLSDKVESITKLPFYKGVKHLTRKDLFTLSTLIKTCHKNSTKPVVVDTSPMNIHYLSFILQLIPKAKFVICQRSPMDTCLSIYQHPLNKNHSYANNLENLANFFQLTNELTEHYIKSYPKNVINVLYEKLVTQPEPQIDSILLELGLKPDTKCHHPEETKRIIRTPSANQVNKQINHKSIGRWKNYKLELQPLYQQLVSLEQQHSIKIK